MAQTRPNIVLPANTWVNVYTELNAQAGFPSVTVGDKLKAENLGATVIKAVSFATQPDHSHGYSSFEPSEIRENDVGDPGAWFYSMGNEGLVNVAVTG